MTVGMVAIAAVSVVVAFMVAPYGLVPTLGALIAFGIGLALGLHDGTRT